MFKNTEPIHLEFPYMNCIFCQPNPAESVDAISPQCHVVVTGFDTVFYIYNWNHFQAMRVWRPWKNGHVSVIPVLYSLGFLPQGLISDSTDCWLLDCERTSHRLIDHSTNWTKCYHCQGTTGRWISISSCKGADFFFFKLNIATLSHWSNSGSKKLINLQWRYDSNLMDVRTLNNLHELKFILHKLNWGNRSCWTGSDGTVLLKRICDQSLHNIAKFSSICG